MHFSNKALLFCVLSLAITACKKDKDDIDISGFTVYDSAGNSFGRVGAEDEDWTFSNNLSSKELALFNFTPTGITLDSTLEGTTSAGIRPYPNPIAYNQRYSVSSSEKVILKMVVVNSQFEVMFQTAQKIQGFSQHVIDFSDRTRFPNHTSYRVYYSLSATGKANFKSGYGDIRICDSPSDWQDCFR